MEEKKKILITCFNKYGINRTNASKKVLENIKKNQIDNMVIYFLSLDVDGMGVCKKSMKDFNDKIEEYNPDYILSMGENFFYRKIGLERIKNEQHCYLFDFMSYNSKMFRVRLRKRETIEVCLEVRNYILDLETLNRIEGCEFLHIPKFRSKKKLAREIVSYLKKLVL